MTELVKIETDHRGVARLILNRADKHNALSGEMCDQTRDAAQELGQDKTVRVVVLQAMGKSFCAGGDLGWMKSQIKATADQRRCEARRLADMLQALNNLPKPLIARVHGNAFGGGIGIIACCDAVVAAEGLTFGLTETKLGLIPATIGPYVAARLPLHQLRRLFMSSRLFGSQRAAEVGLVDRVVTAEKLDEAVEKEVTPYLNCAPGAVAKAKEMLLSLGTRIDTDVIEASLDALVETWEGEEALAGIEAFFAKKPAPWQL